VGQEIGKKIKLSDNPEKDGLDLRATSKKRRARQRKGGHTQETLRGLEGMQGRNS